MKFSILIANYNNGKYFQDCYESIISQTHTDWEVIIVDDGSTDNSVFLIEQIIKNDARFFFYKNLENKGCGAAKKNCVENANGNACGFLDPDDMLLPQALQKMNEMFLQHSDAVLIHSTLLFCDDNLNIKEKYYDAASVEKETADFLNYNHAVTAFATFKMDAYKKTEGISSFFKRAVDQDLYLKMWETGKFYFVNEPLYLYRKHESGISSFGNTKNAQFWHFAAALEACKRRGLDPEKYFLPAFMNRKNADIYRKISNGDATLQTYMQLFLKKIRKKFFKHKINNN